MKCPYCKKKVEYEQTRKMLDGKNVETYCPNCDERIIFSMTISPIKKTQWDKPSFA